MTEPLTLSIDAMSGDAGPAAVVAGLVRYARRDETTRFLLFGDAPTLERLLRRRRAQPLAERVSVRHASDVVRMDDVPSKALRTRRDSSMWAAITAVRDGEARVCVSCGNTGALLAMSMLILRKAPGIDRPAIAVHWPSAQPHGFNTVLDVGADLRAGPRALMQYAVLGAEYARLSFGLAKPVVGLLNIGTEPQKGHAELRLTAEALDKTAALPEARFTSAGFVEGTDIGGATVDVIVTDGFTGNIALKTAEGTAGFIRQGLKDAFAHSPLSRIGQLFALTSLRRLSRRIDPRRVNGGVFLGLNGTVVKSHGRADAVGMDSAVTLATALAENDYHAAVAREIARLDLSHLPHGTADSSAALVSAVDAAWSGGDGAAQRDEDAAATMSKPEPKPQPKPEPKPDPKPGAAGPTVEDAAPTGDKAERAAQEGPR
ncbi:MAG: phosphate acyltransferase PlsX [Pseudomonadota bacterium]